MEVRWSRDRLAADRVRRTPGVFPGAQSPAMFPSEAFGFQNAPYAFQNSFHSAFQVGFRACQAVAEDHEILSRFGGTLRQRGVVGEVHQQAFSPLIDQATAQEARLGGRKASSSGGSFITKPVVVTAPQGEGSQACPIHGCRRISCGRFRLSVH